MSYLRKIGDLEVLEVKGEPDKPCIVMLHGYGADAFDLAPLAQVLQAPAGTTWLFPNGPLQVPIGFHITGRAWFPIDIESLERSMRSGTPREISTWTPPDFRETQKLITDMLAELQIPVHRTVFAGFSQGAMLATALTLNAKENPMGLIIMSGVLIDEAGFKRAVKTRAGLKFYQSHGKFDELLSVKGAQELEKLLVDGGLKGKLTVFPGGHEIPPEVLSGVNKYLSELR